MSSCYECEQKHKNKRKEERDKLLSRVVSEHMDVDSVTLAIVETKNGILGWRPIGDESLKRLRIVEYIHIMQGVIVK